MDAATITAVGKTLTDGITPLIAPIVTTAMALYAVLWVPSKGIDFFDKLLKKAKG